MFTKNHIILRAKDQLRHLINILECFDKYEGSQLR